MLRVKCAALLFMCLAILLASCSPATLEPRVPILRGMYTDPPTQAELDAQLGETRAIRRPAIRGTVFYDQDGDGSPESPACERGVRGVSVSLYFDVDASGTFSPTVDTLVDVAVTDITGAYSFEGLPAPENYLLLLDVQAPGLPAGVIATGVHPEPASLAVMQAKTADLGLRLREAARPLEIVLWEIAWAGTTAQTAQPAEGASPAAASAEWLVLRNTTARTIDLTGWTLEAVDGTPRIALRGHIPAHGFYLLERTADTSAPWAAADQIYTGALNDTGEVLTLSDGVRIIDQVDAWHAGDTTRRTMLRIDAARPGTDPAAWADGPVDGAARNSLVDADGDGFFYSPNPAQAAQSLDCNDADAAIHPGVAELRDLVDQNCNGQVDEGLLLEPYASQVHFTDVVDATGPTETGLATDAALRALFDSAATSIDAAIYDFDRAGVRDALIAAHNRGVRVRVMGDDETYFSSRSEPFFRSLEAEGIPVLADMRGASSLEHNKFAVIDGAKVWTGSFNWSDTAATYNAENALVIASPHLAQAYTTEFAEMFDPLTGRNGICKRDNTTHQFDLGGTRVASYFSPSDGVEQALLDELNAATESIYFAMFFLTSDPVGDVLVNKAKSDLPVAGIFDAVGATNLYSQDAKLCAADLPIKVETFGGKVHHKFAVVDVDGPDPRVITGSYNWTSAGTESNDENTLIIHDAATAQAYYQEYLRLYRSIPDDAICSRHSAESGMPACQDGLDNDYDNVIDAADRDCRESTPARCLDGLDNDNDGLVDTADLDCDRCRLAAQGIVGATTVNAAEPLTATLLLDPAAGPLTFAWSDQPATGQTATGQMATYVWSRPGVYTITASATNWCQTVTSTLTVTVLPGNGRVFLPLLMLGALPR